ncbi:MAG: RNA polymerase sigma factor [Deltaproteobacteria bacterium]|nr:RNA polymerase sigma factor [Deltaproteobacteria bacterium]
MGNRSTSTKEGPERVASTPEIGVVEALNSGNREHALTLLMDAYGDSLYRFCRQMTREASLAEDVHQMTFVQAYQGLGDFAFRSSFRTWLFSIARHRCLDALKILRRRRARFELVDEPPHRPDGTDSADQRLEAIDRNLTLERCLGSLAPRVREAILLRFREESSYTEMALVCREKPATLQARVARAMPLLRRCLEESGVAP